MLKTNYNMFDMAGTRGAGAANPARGGGGSAAFSTVGAAVTVRAARSSEAVLCGIRTQRCVGIWSRCVGIWSHFACAADLFKYAPLILSTSRLVHARAGTTRGVRMFFPKPTVCTRGAVGSCERSRLFVTCALSFIAVFGSAFARATDAPPHLTSSPSRSATVGKFYYYQFRATDADHDKLSFTASHYPAWLRFDRTLGRLYGTPAPANVGVAKGVLVGVTDGKLWTGQMFDLTVNAATSSGSGSGSIERPPVISGAPATSATVGQAYSFTPSASDPNGDKLTFSVQNQPSWAAFNAATGALTGTPTTAGTFSNIVISVSDGTDSVALAGFSIAVSQSVASTPPPTTPPPTTPPPPVAKNCGLQSGGAVTFCDTFDAPAGIGNRSGDLNGNVWGVSRTIGDINLGQHDYDAAPMTELDGCNGATTIVRPPHDVIICNGQVREATNDNPSGVFDAGGVTALAMYPKQPFDFAGRTGTVAFDVSNDTHGNHAAWPEFWMSDLPVPVPFNHFDSWIALPQHGFGVRFAGKAVPGDGGLCPNSNNLDKPRWTVDSGVVVRNYAMEDVNYAGVEAGTQSSTPLKLNILDCVIGPADGSGVMNHVEVRVSQGQIDIYATDAGDAPSPTTLKHIASLSNANLTFTRGLIWLEDVHYNADKGGAPSQRQHTFVWDNVAFDGPFTYRDFSYDALDANEPGPANNAWNLGKVASPNQTASWDVLNLPANPQGTAARVLFNFSEEMNPVPSKLNVIVNGHAHSTPWPYPDKLTNTWRTYAVTVPITDLVAGTNVVQLGADQPLITANVNIVLVNVPGAVPVLPGNSTVYPGSK
jgi:hypothetical protein